MGPRYDVAAINLLKYCALELGKMISTHRFSYAELFQLQAAG